MDTRRKHRSLNCSAMQTSRVTSIELLLRAGIANRVRPPAHELCRRDLYRETLLWFSKNYAQASERRTQCQSQAHPKSDAQAELGRKPTRSPHFKGSPGTCQVPVSPTQLSNLWTTASVEHGHNVYSPTKWICLSCCCNRLVQSSGTLSSSFQQPGTGFLFGGLRGSDCHLWKARNIQYRPGCTVHLPGVCERGTWQKHSFQHVRKRKSARQYFCRAPLEIGKIRRGVPERL